MKYAILIALFALASPQTSATVLQGPKDALGYEECCECTPKARVIVGKPYYHADDDAKASLAQMNKASKWRQDTFDSPGNLPECCKCDYDKYKPQATAEKKAE